ncbi:hypothetical protein MKL09_31130 [Methylobacterium sp. J-048]|uniref:hypothetical protein n=1 Tax=Methylobacterium sp. J-048 TaxID=2836635 RepID=UPI001FBB8021|nr:hypothetical protein [Methylobacterium sp. J-048]MCJ2060961.1 hypothetical protein [Methylobacterium sp. J-048]
MDLISPTAGCLPAPPQLPMTLVPHRSALQLDAASALAARGGEIMVPEPEAAR